MRKINGKDITKIVVLVSIFSMAFFVRIDRLHSQFPTTDDTGVAWTLLSHADKFNAAYIKRKIYDSLHEDYNTPQYKVLRSLDKMGNLQAGLTVLRPVIKMMIIPQTWTYAPIQFIFTSILLNNSQSYSGILFWGRFPSFFFSVLSLVVLVLVVKKMFYRDWFLPAVCCLLLFSFSLENIIYAKHMSNYSAGVFSLLFLIYIFLSIFQGTDRKQKKYVYIGLLISICVGLNYQVLFFIPAFFGTWLIAEKDSIFKGNSSIRSFFQNPVLKKYLTSLITVLFFSSLLVVAFVIPQSRRGEAGATGIPDSFYFHLPNQDVSSSFFQQIGTFLKYAVIFFWVNGFSTVHFLLSSTRLETYISQASTCIFVVIMVIGLIAGIKSLNKQIKRISMFLIFSLITYILLIVLRKIPLSPSRHSLILLPICILLFGLGIFSLFNRAAALWKCDLSYPITVVLSIFVLLPFWGNYSKFISERADLMKGSRLDSILGMTHPELIVLPKYFVMHKLLSPDWKLDEHDESNVYSVYRNSAKGRFNPDVMLVINQSDLFFDYKEPVKLNGRQARLLTNQLYLNTDAALDINKHIKESQNQILFRIYVPVK